MGDSSATAAKSDALASDRLAEAARAVMPGGGSHDFRQLTPRGLFAARGEAGRKWDVDGLEYVDLTLGNGSLLLGHGDAGVTEAIVSAVGRGLHFSAGTEAEVRWAELVCELVPGAERVRFTASGSEACILAAGVAAAATGRRGLATLRGHHPGWALPMASGGAEALDARRTPDELVLALSSGRHAAVLLEPTGASFGKAPLAADEVGRIAEAARSGGALVIFDETLTGFRVSPGGAQAQIGVTPDLTVLGKILGGGLPCGALAGRADLMAALDNRLDAPAGPKRIAHGGTGNGNPVVAAAGLAMLRAIADGEAGRRADAMAGALRHRLNRLFAGLGLAWAAYGQSSVAHLFLNPDGVALDPVRWDSAAEAPETLLARSRVLINDLRVALLAAGVDINGWPGALTCSTHGAADLDRAEAGFAQAIERLRRQGVVLTGWRDAA